MSEQAGFALRKRNPDVLTPSRWSSTWAICLRSLSHAAASSGVEFLR